MVIILLLLILFIFIFFFMRQIPSTKKLNINSENNLASSEDSSARYAMTEVDENYFTTLLKWNDYQQ